MEEMLKSLVKEAVLETLSEIMNLDVALMSTDEVKDENDNNEDDSENKPIRPKPLLGAGGFSLR